MEEIRLICRLCLKFSDELCSDSSDLSLQEKLKRLLPTLNLNNPNEYIICSKCRTSLEDGFQFAQTFSKHNKLIEKERKRLNILTGINLNRMVRKYKLSGGVIKDNELICRFCFSSKVGRCISLSHAYSIYNSLKSVLNIETKKDKDVTINPIVCESCQKLARKINVFIKRCDYVERELEEYSKKSTEEQIDLSKFKDYLGLLHRETPRKYTGELIVAEESTQASTYNSPNTDNNRKRSLSEEGSYTVPAKKRKLPMLGTTFPHCIFTKKFIDSPSNLRKLNDWLSSVCKVKRVLGLSDSVTMDNVLENLKEMDEVHTYFSNLSKTCSWEQWKNKLIRIFPNHNDYGILLKTSCYRRKLPTESYLKYYNAKMRQLKAANITGEDAVSCLLGCLTDKVVTCVGRAGNYKKPKQLKLYFQKCDEKEGLNACEKPEKKLGGCHICKKRSHVASECFSNLARGNIGTVGDKVFQPKKRIRRGGEQRSQMVWRLCDEAELRNEEVFIDVDESDRVLRSSDNTQKHSEQISSSSQEEVVVILSDEEPTSATTLPKQTEDKDRSVKRNQNDGKSTSSTTAKEQNKQKDEGFVKPLPPKSASSATLQGEGSSLSKPCAQKDIRAGGTSAANQSEDDNKSQRFVAQKPQSKENMHSKTQAQSKDRQKWRNELSTPAANKEDNKSSRYSWRRQDRSKERRNPQSKDSSFDRDTSGARPRGHSERRNADTSAATTQDWRKENVSKVHRSRWQERSEESAALQAQYQEFILSHLNRGAPKSQEEEGRPTTPKYDIATLAQMAKDYAKRRMSAASQQDWMEDTYFSSTDVSSPRSRRDIEEGYVNKDIYAADLQNREEDHFGSVRSMASEESYLDSGTTGGRSHSQYGESDVNRARSGIRPDKERDVGYISRGTFNDRPEGGLGSYAMKRLLNSRFQERGDHIVDIHEVETGYTQRFRPQELEGDIDESISNDRWREEELRGRYDNRGISKTRSPMRDEGRNVNTVPSGYRLQEIGDDTINQSIPTDRWQEEEELEGGYADDYIRSRSPLRSHSHAGPDRIKGNEVSMRVSSDRWREIEEEGYFNRDGILRSRSPMRDERHTNRKPFGASRQPEIEIHTVNQNISSDREWDERYNNESLTRRSTMRNTPLSRGQETKGGKDINVSSDGWREERYVNREGRFRSPMHDEQCDDRSPSGGRPLEIDEDNVNQNKFSDGWREERNVNREGTFKSPVQDERHANRGSFGDRPQEVEEDNGNQSEFSDGWRKEKQVGRYVNRGSLGVKLQDDEGNNAYRATFKHRSPLTNEPSNVERMPVTTTDEWESGYVDRNITGIIHGEPDKDGSANVAAPSVRLPAEKEMIGRGFESKKMMKRSYLNKDASSARPSDINYSSRVAPTDNSRKFSQGSYLNKPTPATPRAILPGHGEGNHFNKSISSTRLLGPTLGTLFGSISASRPFTSYPSSVTTAKPLALNRGSYFSRNLLEYNDGKRGASGEINLQRGRDLAKNNYLGHSSAVKHQEQSHRELCLRCYTIGHKSEYCPQFRT